MKPLLFSLLSLLAANVLAQEDEKFYEVVCDSIEFGDTVSYTDVKKIVQVKVYENLPSGEQQECHIVGGKIWVAGVVGNGEFLEGGKVRLYDCSHNPNGCSILLQSKGKQVTFHITVINKKGKERTTGISFEVPI